MSSSLHIGLVQFDPAWENPAMNMLKANQLLEGLNHLDLIVLPEMWSTGFTMQTATASEPAHGPAWKWMKDTAARIQSNIAGSISVKENGMSYNRFYYLGLDGSEAVYDKKHLFSYGH